MYFFYFVMHYEDGRATIGDVEASDPITIAVTTTTIIIRAIIIKTTITSLTITSTTSIDDQLQDQDPRHTQGQGHEGAHMIVDHVIDQGHVMIDLTRHHRLLLQEEEGDHQEVDHHQDHQISAIK